MSSDSGIVSNVHKQPERWRGDWSIWIYFFDFLFRVFLHT